ncbi:hypothetical protein [Noviherbaspirillum autotrophicum]|nr:hypothetical protein [Noviherbaspirillum autotrophicum]
MEFLSPVAARTYLKLCRISYSEGIIGRYEFLSRMRSLCALASSEEEPFQYARNVLEYSGWDKDAEWINKFGTIESSTDEQRTNDRGNALSGEGKWDDEDEEPSYSFMTNASMGFSRKWDFHKGDADPDPSVPHGHHAKHNKRKLHAYRGYVYFQGEPDGREPREAMIRLWNNPDFRDFACEAIMHFVSERPDWVWDRDPLIIPGLRRGY